jgi:hypothetical protein
VATSSERQELEELRRLDELERKAAGPERRSPLEMTRHYAGLMGRGAIRGIAGSVEQFIPPIYPPGGVGRKVIGAIDPAIERGLTRAGLPEPETTGEKVLTGASELLPGLIGGRGVRSAPRTMPLEGKALADSAHNAIINAAKSEGYVLPGQTTLAKVGQLIAGKTPTKSGMIIRNQEVTNKIARREAGLAEDIPITDENLAAARTKLAQPYRDLEKMAPTAGRLWKQVQQTRADAKAQWQFYNRSANPEVRAKAQALDARAESLEDKIDDIAKINLKPDALDRLRQARTELAKNFIVDRANTPGGDVDARSVYRDSKRTRMTGGLKTIADFEIERRPAFGVEMGLEPELHMGGGVGLHHIGLGGWSRGVPFMGPVGRGLAMSKLGQGKPSPTFTTLRDINPSLLLVPGLGLRAPAEEE